MNRGILMTDEQIARHFQAAKPIVERGIPEMCLVWPRKAISEVNVCVLRSLESKFRACAEDGFSVAKVAGCHTFWIAKLKPAFALLNRDFALNEYVALLAGISYVRERMGLQIVLTGDEMRNMCDTLRFHTSSTHMLTHIFAGWIEREISRRK